MKRNNEMRSISDRGLTVVDTGARVAGVRGKTAVNTHTRTMTMKDQYVIQRTDGTYITSTGICRLLDSAKKFDSRKEAEIWLETELNGRVVSVKEINRLANWSR